MFVEKCIERYNNDQFELGRHLDPQKPTFPAKNDNMCLRYVEKTL